MRPHFTVAGLMTIVLLVGLVFGLLKISADKNAEIANLRAHTVRIQTKADRQRMAFLTVIEELRQRLELADGLVTRVDDARREFFIDITQRQGARPLMKMLVFDSGSSDVPTERPVGLIEVTQVGEQYSTARIIKTNRPDEPIRAGGESG
jgi:hypothetical protein